MFAFFIAGVGEIILVLTVVVIERFLVEIAPWTSVRVVVADNASVIYGCFVREGDVKSLNVFRVFVVPLLK